MNRSRYYRPATMPVLTYVLTGVAAFVVFGSILYLQFYNSPNERLLSANRYPPNYPAVPGTELYDDSGQSYQLNPPPCGSVLLAPLVNACPSLIEEHRQAYQAVRALLSQQQIPIPPLYLLDPAPLPSAPVSSDLADTQQHGLENALTQACSAAELDAQAPVLRGQWHEISKLYEHFNLNYTVPADPLAGCADKQTASWILLDSQASPVLYFHTLKPATTLASEYLKFLTRRINSDNAQSLQSPQNN